MYVCVFLVKMPKVKEGLPYKRKYKEDDLQNALDAIEQGMALREAAKTFEIPRATLQFRKSGKFNKTALGPNPVLTSEEESVLVTWIVDNHRKGFPRRKLDVQHSVKEFLEKSPRENPFTNNLPGDGWYRAFLNRHPELTTRTSEAVTSASSQVSEKDVKKWFGDIHFYLTSKGLQDILNDPSRILNGDETNFNLCPKNSKVLAPKGARNVYEIENAPSKSNITVMFTFTASGHVTPPMIIFPYKRLPVNILNSVTSVSTEWGIGLSESGWMRSEIFYEYISKVLHPSLKKLNTQFPVILFIDGHSTHLTYKLSELCTKLEIILICLYPNTTRILQPADVACFKPLKNGWKKAVLDWRRTNPIKTLSKEHFAPILKNVIDDFDTKTENIRNGFRACGLYPWDPDAIDFSKCLGKQSTKVKENEITGNSKELLLTLTTFKNIVGENKLKEFEKIESINDEVHSEDFALLYNVYTAFEASGINKEQNVKKSPTIIEDTVSQLDDTEQTFEKDDAIVETLPDSLILPNTLENDETATLLVSATNNDLENLDIQNLPIVFSENWITSVEEESVIQDITIIENEDILINNCTEMNNDVLNIPHYSRENSLDNSSLGNTSIESILQWPITPKRKGIKQTERLPFVLTSTQWKKMHNEKEELKRKKELEKEDRKRKRLEKAEIKKNADMGKKKKIRKTITSPVIKIPQQKAVNSPVRNNFIRETYKSPGTVISRRTVASPVTKILRRGSVTKNLFREESPKKEDNCYKLQNDIGLDSKKNFAHLKGLCYSCGNNLTNHNFGIKCHSCIRIFHINCIIKFKLHKSNSDLFECITCLKKNNL